MIGECESDSPTADRALHGAPVRRVAIRSRNGRSSLREAQQNRTREGVPRRTRRPTPISGYVSCFWSRGTAGGELKEHYCDTEPVPHTA